jgi:uncharacterized protein (TIGR03118 family)
MPISIAPLVVSIPGGAPTGTVFNPSTAFKVHVGNQDLPATFIFDSEAGTITAWPFTDPPGTSATTEVTVAGAIFKGLARGFVHGRGQLLYAADFHHNQIVVVNGRFHRVHLAGAFHDPNLPHGFAPFNIRTSTDACTSPTQKQDPAATDEIAGAGLGFVDVYSRRGFLMHRVVSRGRSTRRGAWCEAPGGFGRFSRALLVGNFGNGMINAYNIRTGGWLGELRRPNGHAVQIDYSGAFGSGNGVTGDRKSLLFNAGIDDRAHGLFGPDPARPTDPRGQAPSLTGDGVWLRRARTGSDRVLTSGSEHVRVQRPAGCVPVDARHRGPGLERPAHPQMFHGVAATDDDHRPDTAGRVRPPRRSDTVTRRHERRAVEREGRQVPTGVRPPPRAGPRRPPS